MTIAHDITPPSVHGKQYTLEQRIGLGASSVVFKGYEIRDEARKRPVAIKVHKNDKPTRLRSEIGLLVHATTHENVAQYLDHSYAGRYIALELMPETLLQRFKWNTVTQQVIMDYLLQIPAILGLFREKGIAHCDLKAGNVGYKERVMKVLDFGLAIPLQQTVYRPSRGEVQCYLAPELHYGLVTPTSDTYSAGKIVQFLLTGDCCPTMSQALQDMELWHDVALPRTFKQVLRMMTQKEHVKRPAPAPLREMTMAAAHDLDQDLYFTPQTFVTLADKVVQFLPS